MSKLDFNLPIFIIIYFFIIDRLKFEKKIKLQR